jgi:hypothetical protein
MTNSQQSSSTQRRVSIPMKTSNAVLYLHSLGGLVLLFLPNHFLSDDTSINLPASSSAPSVE